MYEHLTFEYLLNRMLNRVKEQNPNLDTREGSVIYNALAPTAMEFANAYIIIDDVFNQTFADTANRENLIKRAKERGVFVKPATKAIRKGIFDKEIPINTRFSLNSLRYRVIKKITDFEYQMECETEGVIGNVENGKLIPIDYIEGLKVAALTDVLIPGEDEEDTEVLRNRYFDSLNAKSFGGNITDYKEKTKTINGVGGVKVYPAWNGGGTVKLVIINSDFEKPSDTLIDNIQTVIDPIQNQGKGDGLAPIGHTVTVESVQLKNIDIKTNIIFNNEWNFENSKKYLDEIIDNYFKELAINWEREKNLIIRISQIEFRLLEFEGILDVNNTQINGIEENLKLDSDFIPIRNSIGAL